MGGTARAGRAEGIFPKRQGASINLQCEGIQPRFLRRTALGLYWFSIHDSQLPMGGGGIGSPEFVLSK